jgi:acetate---CoA ligase (ADP-forming)
MSVAEVLFRPRSIAIVGASADPNSVTGRPITYLRRHGFAGEIFPINPRHDSIAGLRCYPDVASLPCAPDVGLVLVGANRVAESIGQLSKIGAAAAIVLAGGFGEAGVEGERRQAALREAAGNLRILGPNTIGLINLTDNIILSPSGALALDEFPTGGIGLISQSGGILGSLLSRAAGRGIGLSKLVATGNESDLDVSDFIDGLAEDDATRVIALYLETIRDVDAFRSAVGKAIRRGKPVVVHKVGRSALGAQTTMSHTGALAGADRIYDALFKQVGAIRAATFSDLLDIPAALSTRKTLRGKRVAIVTSTGGAATLVADSIGLAGFEAPAPDPATASELQSLNIPEASLDHNPFDVTLAGLKVDVFRRAIRALARSPSYDAVAVIVGSSSISQPEVVAGPLVEVAGVSEKPIIAYVSAEAPAIVRSLNARGIPAYASADSCAAALSGLLLQGRDASAATSLAMPQAAERLALPEKSTLNEAESKRLFARFGIRITQEHEAATAEEAQAIATKMGSSVVVKILSRNITHKSDVGGVAVDVAPADVRNRCETMAQDVEKRSGERPEGFLIQEFVTKGLEFILGARRDPQLGKFILLGFGGITAELFNDTAIRMLPLDRSGADAMIDELKTSALLSGYRGRPPADRAALVEAILSFANLAASLGDRLGEAEINPLFVLPDGLGVCAADGVVVLA